MISFILCEPFLNSDSELIILTSFIIKLRDLGRDEYTEMSERCILVSKQKLDFDKQMSECFEWLKGNR